MRTRWIASFIVSVALLCGCSSGSKQREVSTQYQLSPPGSADWQFGFNWTGKNETKSSDTDSIGQYDAVTRDVTVQGVPLTESIRTYPGKSVSLFTLTYDAGADKPLVAFPDFDQLPANLHVLSYQEKAHAPVAFKPEASGSPWLLFDDNDNAMLIAPASNFLVQRINGDAKTHVTSELRGTVKNIPAGFTQQTLVVSGKGINNVWDQFGDALRAVTGKTRPANDSDLGLKYLGYWTDNGSFYYYNFNPNLGYGGTLIKLSQHFRDENIPVKYMQLDSWWYYKSFTGPDGKPGKTKNDKLPAGEWNRYGGLMEYRAHPGVFPEGLAKFQEQLGLPLITHNRWVDPASPYQQEYKISGFAGVDPAYWRDIIDYINDAGVFTYEQDWLSEIYLHSPELSSSVDMGDKFLGGMANAARNRGMSVQYCMAMPQYYMQGSKYNNVTTIRPSDDRFKRDRWHDFLYASRLAASAGIWPWADTYLSTEKGNVLLSDLSAGMVGFGDEMGTENVDNLYMAVRKDGVIVKPDEPIVPVDSAYIAEANKQKRALVSSTFTDHGGVRTEYVLAYRVPAPKKKATTEKSPNEKSTAEKPATRPAGRLSDKEVLDPVKDSDVQEAMFTLHDIGVSDPAYVYDFVNKSATWMEPSIPVIAPLGAEGFNYYVVASPGQSGIAFLGDLGKWASCGKQRIAEIHEQGKRMAVKVLFASGENSATLHGCSATPVTATVGGQDVKINYDPASQHFTADLNSDGADSVTIIFEAK